ncbi:MAG TPA: lipase [Candidatus Corynebacterium avicola]|uniref:Lipase n=1 Tax=Candidatus Corynebacterium avicola TaxID=2838527 RepID=A0A9D1UKX1_9CORY|nr:lipase [Candidatus Corynebacterium avicola]
MSAEPSLTSIPLTTDLVPGIAEFEPTDRGARIHRLPAATRARFTDAQLSMVETQPAGARVALRTDATRIELDVLRTRPMYEGVPPRPDGVYDIVVDGELVHQVTSSGGDALVMDAATGTSRIEPGPVATIAVDLPAGARTVEIWLPHNEVTELVDLRSNAPVEPAARTAPRWVHHGSSVSHGSNAATPTGTWPVIAARATGADLYNLGFGGSALVDPFIARTIAEMEADVISVKFGINVVNSDLMRRRAFGPAVHGFLDTIRDRHPDIPLILMSSAYCPIQETTPGPLAPDFSDGTMKFAASGDPAEVTEGPLGKLSLEVVRSELEAVVAQRADEDPNLSYVNGLDLYGPADHDEFPLTDNLHPGPEAHRLIGERFIPVLRGQLR